MELTEIAKYLKEAEKKVILIYAFNSTGKTRLSVAYKDATKNKDGVHSGVYYNAFSEDLFVWDNDEENNGENIRLSVKWSSLNNFHDLLKENEIRQKLTPYNPNFDFYFNPDKDPEKGIESISFFAKDAKNQEESDSIKISRGEERIFVWCFFLALFEVEGWSDQQSSHFFIDDPVSSLDDYNIFVTASTLFDLIDNHHENRKIILTTHHIGLFSILQDWLTRGEKSAKFKDITKLFILSRKSGELKLEDHTKDVLLYHLRLLQVLEQAKKEDKILAFHFALLRQILETIQSFHGVPHFSIVLKKIGFDAPGEVARIVNSLSHKKVYYYESDMVSEPDKVMLIEIFNKLKEKYYFVL